MQLSRKQVVLAFRAQPELVATAVKLAAQTGRPAATRSGAVRAAIALAAELASEHLGFVPPRGPEEVEYWLNQVTQEETDA